MIQSPHRSRRWPPEESGGRGTQLFDWGGTISGALSAGLNATVTTFGNLSGAVAAGQDAFVTLGGNLTSAENKRCQEPFMVSGTIYGIWFLTPFLCSCLWRFMENEDRGIAN